MSGNHRNVRIASGTAFRPVRLRRLPGGLEFQPSHHLGESAGPIERKVVSAGVRLQPARVAGPPPRGRPLPGALPERPVFAPPVRHVDWPQSQRHPRDRRGRGSLAGGKYDRPTVSIGPGGEEAVCVGCPLGKAAQVSPALVHWVASRAPGQGGENAFVGGREPVRPGPPGVGGGQRSGRGNAGETALGRQGRMKGVEGRPLATAVQEHEERPPAQRRATTGNPYDDLLGIGPTYDRFVRHAIAFRALRPTAAMPARSAAVRRSGYLAPGPSPPASCPGGRAAR